MKRFLIPFVLLATLLTFVRIGFALSGPTLTTPNVKQLLADGDMEATNAAVAFYDGNMEAAGTGSWTPSQATITKEIGTPHTGTQLLRVTYNGFADGAAVQGTVIVGHIYHITGWVRGDETSSPLVTSAWMSPIYFSGTASNSWQSFDVTVAATATYLQFGSHNLSSTHYVEFDDITVTDVTAVGWSTYQAVLSKQTGTPHSGKQSVRVTPTISGAEADGIQTVLTIGKNYRVSGFARCDGTSGRIPKIFIGGNDIAWTGTNSNTWQAINGTANAKSTSFYLWTGGSALGWCEFDDIFVTEVTGYTQVQDKQTLVDGDMETTNPAVPLVDGDMEADLYGPWSINNPGIFTKEGNAYQGTRCLRATNSVGAGAGLFQTPVTAGRTYKITGAFRGDGQGVSYPRVRLSSAITISGTNSNTWQTFTVTGVVNNTYLILDTLGATGYAEFDDITITDVTAGSWQTVQSVLSKQTTSPHGGNQVIRVAYDNTNADGYAIQNMLTIGKKYRMTGWMRGDGTSYPQIYLGGGGTVKIGTASTAWQYFDVTKVANLNTLIDLASVNLSAGHYVEFDDVMVTEDKGKQQVINKQVIVEGDMEGLPVALADAAMEAAGTGSWTPSQATLSKQTTNPHGGTQVLRVAYDGNPAHTSGEAYQSGVLTAGRTYRLTGWARADSGGVAYPMIMDAETTPVWTGVPGNAWQYIDTTFVAAGGTWPSFIEPYAYSIGAAGRYAEFDDLSIVDIGTTAWSPGSSLATLTKSTASPHGGKYALRAAWAQGTYVYASGGAIFTPGRTYRMTGWVRSDGVSIPTINMSGGQLVWTGTAATTWQKIDVTFKPMYDSLYLLYYASSAAWVEWDDLYATLVQ